METGKVIVFDPGHYLGLLIKSALRDTGLNVVNEEPIDTPEAATRIIQADKKGEIGVAVVSDMLWHDKRAKASAVFVRKLRELHPDMGIIGIYRSDQSSLRRHEVDLSTRLSHDQVVNSGGAVVRDFIQHEL